MLSGFGPAVWRAAASRNFPPPPTRPRAGRAYFCGGCCAGATTHWHPHYSNHRYTKNPLAQPRTRIHTTHPCSLCICSCAASAPMRRHRLSLGPSSACSMYERNLWRDMAKDCVLAVRHVLPPLSVPPRHPPPTLSQSQSPPSRGLADLVIDTSCWAKL